MSDADPDPVNAAHSVTRFTIRPDQSELWARAVSSLHPISYTAPVTGDVQTVLQGDAFDTSQQIGGAVQIVLDELTSDEPRFDREMRDRLDAQRFPTVTARLHRADPAGDDRYRLSGELTLHGKTRTLHGDAHVALHGSQLHASGRVVIDIRDFGVEPPKLLMLKVDPEVEIAIEIVADLDVS